MRKIKVHFADWGQDLLWFVVDTHTTQVTEAGPFHNELYKGAYVFCPRTLRPGIYLDYSKTPILEVNHPLETIKYKIIKIEEVA